MNQVKSITIVGGGSSGLITGLILKESLDIDINLIYLIFLNLIFLKNFKLCYDFLKFFKIQFSKYFNINFHHLNL